MDSGPPSFPNESETLRANANGWTLSEFASQARGRGFEPRLPLSPIDPLEPGGLRELESLLVLSCGDATVKRAVFLWLTDHHPIRGVLIHDVDVGSR